MSIPCKLMINNYYGLDQKICGFNKAAFSVKTIAFTKNCGKQIRQATLAATRSGSHQAKAYLAFTSNLFKKLLLFFLRINRNIYFQDNTIDLFPLPEKEQDYAQYLDSSLKLILEIRRCPVNRMTLCVTSDPEMEKCIKMKVSLTNNIYF